MQDFIYYNKNGLDFPVSEKIQVTTSLDGLDNQTFLISNTKDVKSEFVANEIDFYIKNSQDNLPNKISNVLELYEIAVTKYDLSQDISYSQEISKELLVVTNSEEQFKEFTKYLNKDDFDIYKINENILKSIEGHIGNLKVTIKQFVNMMEEEMLFVESVKRFVLQLQSQKTTLQKL